MKSPSLKVMKGALRTKEEFENKPPPKERKVRQKARTRDCDLVATQATILQETETTGIGLFEISGPAFFIYIISFHLSLKKIQILYLNFLIKKK